MEPRDDVLGLEHFELRTQMLAHASIHVFPQKSNGSRATAKGKPRNESGGPVAGDEGVVLRTPVVHDVPGADSGGGGWAQV